MKNNLIIKLIAIFAISIGLIVLLQTIEFKIDERSQYKNAAKSSIAQGWSNQQLVIAPILQLTLQKKFTREVFDKNLKNYVIKEFSETWSEFHLPETLTINGDIALQERYKGIYKIPVYEADFDIQGQFSPIAKAKEPGHQIISAHIISSFSDMRGISSTPTLSINDKDIVFRTGTKNQLLGGHISAQIDNFNPNIQYHFSMQNKLRGLDSLNFVPTGKQVSVTLRSPWQHPYFIGHYLPDSREINKGGFIAKWNMSEFATSIQKVISHCNNDNDCRGALQANSFGVGMHNPIDIYQKTDRSLKYAFLFIALTFVTFCLFETIKRIQIHPIQYAFVGAALALFYLLLIALSEHINFGLAYLIATICCISIVSFYLLFVFKNRTTALSISSGMLILYAMLYMILKSEDYALLMGAALTFASLACLMLTTRHIDWYVLTTKQETRNIDS